ncbi:mirror-image polydactyly gene 1 protein [Cheilinus undulatus]|uniref:mirror-image polydactyly gene 1 protein n=1 Tax=Cheilinus undulatus TaxID=241271 RepID=UPI001BD5AC1B|nr:mirror-image polydactyly gene 1 protein [Cheilinus undulatus]
MYTANPKVNIELRQRLPSPGRQRAGSPDRSRISRSVELSDGPEAPRHLQDPPTSSSPSPLSHRRSLSPVSPLSHRRSASPISPLSHRRSLSPASPLRGGVGDMELDLPPSPGPSPRPESRGDVSDGGRVSRGPGSPAVRRHLVKTEDSSHQEVTFGPITASSRVQTFDRDKNISFLLKELDALRDINKKLQDQLVQKEKELQRREVEEELREEQREAQIWERPTAMLGEVLSAQKDRDQALMSRLLLANEERDEALLRARQLQHAAEYGTLRLDGVHLEDSDMDVEELLQSVCDAESMQEVQQFGAALVQRLQLAKQRRCDITAQEMKAVMEERDGSIAKCKRLEQDLIQEREQRATKEDLLRLQRERGGALEDKQRLEVELQALRANHSSQDLLSPPPSLLANSASPAGSLVDGHEAPPPQAAHLLVQVQQLSREKQSMEAELQRCQEAEREASERVRRLERLVEVLRKKVGTGSLRAVI